MLETNEQINFRKSEITYVNWSINRLENKVIFDEREFLI